MSNHHDNDAEIIQTTRNTARYFAENPQIGWVLLILTLCWGIFSYHRMPKAKDPRIPVRVAVATCNWPGASAEKIESLVTRKIEAKIAENSKVDKVQSLSRSSISIVYITLNEDIEDTAREFDDIKLKLDSIADLPAGAGPVFFVKDFGDTAALLLTVASPQVNDIEIALRSKSVKSSIAALRSTASDKDRRVTFLLNFPPGINSHTLRHTIDAGLERLSETGTGRDPRVVEGPGFLGLDFASDLDDAILMNRFMAFADDQLRLSELHPDVWRPILIRDPQTTEDEIAAVADNRYSYRQLDEYTDKIQRYLQNMPLVSKVSRSGVLPERIYLEYSQEKLASYGFQNSSLKDILAARNITLPGGVVEILGKNVTIDPSGELKSEREIGDIAIDTSGKGHPIYLRDVVEIDRSYESPPRFLNFITLRDSQGLWKRSRAITLAVQMRPGEQIAEFGQKVDERLAQVKQLLPDDLVIRRTSDQALQMRENVGLFMRSLFEAVIIVIIVAFIGFWQWRSTLLLTLSIPLTLAMTFGLMHALGIDIQQISIASLILALGLLVDDPVVAADAIKRSLDQGHKPMVAAWLGPTKLATAIVFATITNIAAYLPFLTLKGDVGRFIYSLPVVLTCSLVASRVVSMSFVPLLGFHLLRPHEGKSGKTKFSSVIGQFLRSYRGLVRWSIDHRYWVIAIALFGFSISLLLSGRIKTSFFPQDTSHLSYVDVWLPEDSPLSATRSKVDEALAVIEQTADSFGKKYPGPDGKPAKILASVTSFIGGGAPRFWYSVSPELSQPNYAQLLIELHEKKDTPLFAVPLQQALSSRIAGARFDVRQLENGKPVGIPISVRISGENMEQLRNLAEQVKSLLRSLPNVERIRDDWGAETFSVKLEVDPDRANLAGITNLDVAASSAVAMNGTLLSYLRDGERQIPIIARLRAQERAQLADIQNLYVNSLRNSQKVPLKQLSRIAYRLETEKIRRRNQFRTITVSCFPVANVLPSEVLKGAQVELNRIMQAAPLGYTIALGGEQEERKKGFAQLMIVLVTSILSIYVALLVQFKSAIKPLLVFATIPFGVGGALASLALLDAPFGFMAFLGIISLIGVIVSHIIVLFDFIEERQQEGQPLQQALLEAGVVRLRPVMITVAATVLGLLPLAHNGGPLWQPLCYTQIGGLTVATFLTLLLVPVLYTIFVCDLKWIRWERSDRT